MILKNLGALCKRAGCFNLLDDMTEDGEIRGQWLGEGTALYLVTGLPQLHEENLVRMFDITEKQKKKLLFSLGPLPESLNFENVIKEESVIEDNLPLLCVGRYTVKPILTKKGIVFLDADLFSPLRDTLDVLELWERCTDTGRVYFTVKLGFIVVAVLVPLDILDEDFVRHMELIAKESRAALKAKADTVQPGREEQVML
jgi:hypothetical protein